MLTKRYFVMSALREIGIASADFDLQPEELQDALKRLEGMMSTWHSQGIEIGYPMSTSSDLDDEVSITDAAHEAIVTNLAVRLAPSYGKMASQDTRKVARDGYNVLLIRAARPSEMRIGPTPVGAGNKSTHRRYVSTTDDLNFLTGGGS